MALLDDLGNPEASQLPQAEPSALMGDLGIQEDEKPAVKEPQNLWESTKGEIDAGLAIGSGVLAGTAGSVLRTANRILPDWLDENSGTQQGVEEDINKLQNSLTYEPKTPEGRWTLGTVGKVVKPIAHAAGELTGSVIGKENVPVAADVAGAIPGLDFLGSAPQALVRGMVRGGSAGAEGMAASAKAAEDAGMKTSVGAASGNPIIRSYEAVASKLPGGGPLKEARDVNAQAEASVGDIIKKIHPEYDSEPTTARSAGEEIKEGVDKTILNQKKETGAAAAEMNKAVGGEHTPMAGTRLEYELNKVMKPTGIPEVDEALQGAKTRAAAKVVQGVTERPKSPTSYETDGEGAHKVTSTNGETHAVETADGNIKVIRSDTAEEARGRGEGTDRLEVLAHTATAKGKALISDTTVSPAQAAAYEKLGRQGWKVEKNPNAEVNPDTGNILSDSPKNPVYKVTAPKTETTPGTGSPKGTSEKQFSGEWTYDPKTGKTEPVTSAKPQETASTDTTKAQLNPETPWTFGGYRALRTQIGRAISSTRDVGQKSQLQRLYSAMSDDLKEFVRSKGPEAEQNYEMFNSIAKKNIDSQKALTKIIKNEGGPGEIFNKAMRGSAADSDRISRVMGAMDKDGQNTLRAVVLHKMGRVSGSETGPFKADTFLKNWDKMSQPAKNALFGGAKEAGQLRKSLDSLANALGDMKAGGQLKSGLTESIQSAGHGIGKGAGLIGALLFLKEFGHPMARIATGHPFTAAGAAIAGGTALAINPVMSRVLTNPKVVSWLAQATKVPKTGVPAMLVQLGQMGQKDPDAKDLYDLIQNSDGGATKEPPKEEPMGTIYPKINRSAGMQPLPGGGFGIPPETM